MASFVDQFDHEWINRRRAVYEFTQFMNMLNLVRSEGFRKILTNHMMNSLSIDPTSQNPRRYPLSIVTLGLAVMSAALLVIGIVLVFSFPAPEGHYSPLLGNAGPFVLITVLGSACFAPLSLILGIISLYMISKSQGHYYGKRVTWIGIALSGAMTAFFCCPTVLFI